MMSPIYATLSLCSHEIDESGCGPVIDAVIIDRARVIQRREQFETLTIEARGYLSSRLRIFDSSISH
jgi:hypothetical protein